MRSCRILLATMLVFAASFATVPARALFVGDLYVSTSGPWYAGFFNPSAVMQRKVGTIQFDASSTDFATLTYTDNNLCFAAGTLGGVER